MKERFEDLPPGFYVVTLDDGTTLVWAHFFKGGPFRTPEGAYRKDVPGQWMIVRDFMFDRVESMVRFA